MKHGWKKNIIVTAIRYEVLTPLPKATHRWKKKTLVCFQINIHYYIIIIIIIVINIIVEHNLDLTCTHSSFQARSDRALGEQIQMELVFYQGFQMNEIGILNIFWWSFVSCRRMFFTLFLQKNTNIFKIIILYLSYIYSFYFADEIHIAKLSLTVSIVHRPLSVPFLIRTSGKGTDMATTLELKKSISLDK